MGAVKIFSGLLTVAGSLALLTKGFLDIKSGLGEIKDEGIDEDSLSMISRSAFSFLKTIPTGGDSHES